MHKLRIMHTTAYVSESMGTLYFQADVYLCIGYMRVNYDTVRVTH